MKNIEFQVRMGSSTLKPQIICVPRAWGLSTSVDCGPVAIYPQMTKEDDPRGLPVGTGF